MYNNSITFMQQQINNLEKPCRNLWFGDGDNLCHIIIDAAPVAMYLA